MAQHSAGAGGVTGIGGVSWVVGVVGGDSGIGGVSAVVGVGDGDGGGAGLVSLQRFGGDVRLLSSGCGSMFGGVESVGSIMCIRGGGAVWYVVIYDGGGGVSGDCIS
jgi:hypothetical protein